MSNIDDLIISGTYRNKLKLPTECPYFPKLFTKSILEMTDLEINQIVRVRDEYYEAIEDYDRKCRLYAENEVRLLNTFWADVFTEHNIDKDHPLCSWIRQKSHKYAISKDLHKVYACFQELAGVMFIWMKHHYCCENFSKLTNMPVDGN